MKGAIWKLEDEEIKECFKGRAIEWEEKLIKQSINIFGVNYLDLFVIILLKKINIAITRAAIL